MQNKTRGVRHPVTRVVPMLLCAAMLTGCAALDSRAAQPSQSQTATKPAPVESVDSAESQASAESGACSTLPRVEVSREAVEGYTVAEQFLTSEAYGDPVEGSPDAEFSREEELFGEDGELYAKITVSTRFFGLPVDTGTREFATSNPGLNAAGAPATYVISEGDAFEAIAKRFCLPTTYLSELNWNRSFFSPGDEVLLLPEA